MIIQQLSMSSRHKGSGKSKATTISDGQVILLDQRCDVIGVGVSNLVSQ